MSQNLLLDFFDLQVKKIKHSRATVSFFAEGNRKKMKINWLKLLFSLY